MNESADKHESGLRVPQARVSGSESESITNRVSTGHVVEHPRDLADTVRWREYQEAIKAGLDVAEYEYPGSSRADLAIVSLEGGSICRTVVVKYDDSDAPSAHQDQAQDSERDARAKRVDHDRLVASARIQVKVDRSLGRKTDPRIVELSGL